MRFISHLPLLLLPYVRSRGFNVTIDDTYGDVLTGLIPQYSPESYWKSSTEGNIDGSQLHYDTARGLFGTGNISLAFNGTEVYVYFAVDPSAGADIAFFLDGGPLPAGRYERNATSGGSPYLYNQLVFQSDALAEKRHDLTVVVNSISIGCLYFDYAVYSTGDPDMADPQPHGESTAVDVCAIVGPAAAGALVVALCCWMLVRRRRRRRRDLSEAESIDASPPSASTDAGEPITPFTAHPASETAVPAPNSKDGCYPWRKALGPPPPQWHDTGLESEGSGAGREGIRGQRDRAGFEIYVLGHSSEPPPY
ncbi:hypothetical protein AURDEDRAFT_164371 [Auricularia subglabra TFB-10046 SS5]|nr:hypothetical protein AURDEDRAFT_164371 [Auricularia subglabra TFB-10046 SS5]